HREAGPEGQPEGQAGAERGARHGAAAIRRRHGQLLRTLSGSAGPVQSLVGKNGLPDFFLGASSVGVGLGSPLAVGRNGLPFLLELGSLGLGSGVGAGSSLPLLLPLLLLPPEPLLPLRVTRMGTLSAAATFTVSLNT